jgi:hypothetical protein
MAAGSQQSRGSCSLSERECGERALGVGIKTRVLFSVSTKQSRRLSDSKMIHAEATDIQEENRWLR